MRYAHIENGRVVNVIEADSPDVLPGLTLVADDDGKAIIGGTWTKKDGFVAPPEPEPEPEPSDQEKLERLLRDYGLTREALKRALG